MASNGKEYKIEIEVGNTQSLIELGFDENDIKNYTFSSTESEHASISSQGIITAKGCGQATISVYPKDVEKKAANRLAAIKVTVIANKNEKNFYDMSNMNDQLKQETILSAKEIVNKLNNEEEEEYKIEEGIKYLENIKPTLPLPRTISGRVRIEDDSTSTNISTMTGSGLLVSISGISNPAKDKDENEKDYSCYTDPNGKFTIAMPDRYNMQETITISVSKTNDMTYAISGQSSSHKVQFVKQSSEVLKNEYIQTSQGKKYATDILATINKVYDNNTKAKEIEKNLYKLAYCEYAKSEYEQKKNEVKKAIKIYKGSIYEDAIYRFEENEKQLIHNTLKGHDKELKNIVDKILELELEGSNIIASIINSNEAIPFLYKKNDEATDTSTITHQQLIEILLLIETKYHCRQFFEGPQQIIFNTASNLTCSIEDLDVAIAIKKFATNEVATKEAATTSSEDSMVPSTKTSRAVTFAEFNRYKNKLLEFLKENFKYCIDLSQKINTDTDSRCKAIKTVLNFFEKTISYSKAFQKTIAALNDNYFAIIKYYEDEYLSNLTRLFQEFYTEASPFLGESISFQEMQTYKTTHLQLSSIIGNATNDYLNYKTLKEIINKTSEIRTNWEKELNEFENAVDTYSDTDPYEEVINQFSSDSDHNLLNKKIDDYKKAKEALQKIDEGLDYVQKLRIEYEKNNQNESYFIKYINKLSKKDTSSQTNDDYAETLYKQYDELIKDCQKELSELQCLDSTNTYATNKDLSITQTMMQAVENSVQIERYLLNFLSTPMDSEFEDAFVINQSDFEDSSLHPRALPSVKLMGDGKNEVYLPTDTAPSRMFNYTMVHRLVEPQLKRNGIRSIRNKLDKAVGIHQFKENLCNKQESLALASTLGIGYALNMHQAWVPDGFALGNLLYSLVLAPGEEQRLIVREHKEDYTVSDDANAIDRVHDSYSSSQVDNETAAFNNAVSRFSTAHSDSAYSAQAKSSGKTRINFFQGIGASSSATSTNSGSSHANSSQRDSYDEASHAAQNFQTSIKTESERIASANRTSIRVATSEESEAVSSRIIANHNHSHVMTVQYWEVARRYRLETCIDGIELLLFVPLELIRFMPDKYKSDAQKPFSEYTLQIAPNSDDGNIVNYNKENFEYRYKNILKYYDTIEPYVPVKYRSGLNLIKKFAALPYWGVQKISSTAQKYYVTITGGFCEFDNLTATIYFNNGSRPVQGILTELSTSSLKKADGRNPHTRKETIEAITNARRNKEGTASFAFTLPYTCSKEDISQIKIYNNISSWKYTLSKASSDMDASEQEAVNKYEQIFNFNKNNKLQQILLAFYSQSLPECYSNPEVSFSSWELHSFGDLEIEIKNADGEIGSGTLGYNALNIYIDNTYPTLRLTDIQKIEETFHHIVSDTMYYSQVVWSSLSDDERIILLEPYTIEIDNLNRIASSENSINNIYNKTRSISLLNCVNAKNVVGFYGNCMMLPFTFPKEIAELIGKTAGDIQDELYRYHACNFRVPSTVISIPTDGMVGEAVLGATNVSEKIDITRFWNWKDSDIDHIDLNQSSLNGRSLLENASTKDIEAPTVGVTPTEHINGNNLAAALIARQQPTFADVYQNTDMRDVMKNADNNASAGREQIIKTNAELTKAALDAAVKAGEAALTGGASGALGGAGGALSGSSLTSLVDNLGKLGLSDSDILKSITKGGGTAEGIIKAAAGLSKEKSDKPEGTSPDLTSALKSFGGEKLKQFLSNFASTATNGESLEENFKKSLSSVTGTNKDVTLNDILEMSNKFCSENNIDLSSFTSELGKALGLF